MKHILFILSIIFCCSCSNEMMVDDQAAITRAINSDKTYYLGPSDSSGIKDYIFPPKGTTQPVVRTFCSYVESNGVKTMLQPEIVSKPSWVNYLVCSQYYDMYLLFLMVEDYSSASKRSGNIVLKQPESNKTLSIGITQNGNINNISISVRNTYKNQYMFIANTEYAVEKEVGVKIPLVVYNDGGELSHNATIAIPKGEKTGSYIMDWNASPLVYYHGDIKGYTLYEGNIYKADDIYTYTLRRYW